MHQAISLRFQNILFTSLKEEMNYPMKIHMKTRARKSSRLVFKSMDCLAALIFIAGGMAYINFRWKKV